VVDRAVLFANICYDFFRTAVEIVCFFFHRAFLKARCSALNELK